MGTLSSVSTGDFCTDSWRGDKNVGLFAEELEPRRGSKFTAWRLLGRALFLFFNKVSLFVALCRIPDEAVNPGSQKWEPVTDWWPAVSGLGRCPRTCSAWRVVGGHCDSSTKSSHGLPCAAGLLAPISKYLL
jgi:hypothetical protein